MRKIILYIAMSLDGYIADRRGGVGWLAGQDAAGQDMDSYGEFIQTVDTVLMGWNTYHQIVTELSPGAWPYAGLTVYVFTHRTPPPADGIVFTAEDPCALAARLRSEPGKAIWICGGAQVLAPLLAADLIDEYDISIIPTVLGSGVRLFGKTPGEQRLKLVSAHSGNGIVELVYRRR